MQATTKLWLSLTSPPLTTIAVVLLATSLFGQTPDNSGATVTATTGDSWIRLLHKPFSETSMAKTWNLGPAPPRPGEEGPSWQLELTPSYTSRPVTLHGSDLYRLSCRGCHGAAGYGAPSEINSVIGPVQATSVEGTMERMKKAGREMSRSDVTAVAKESKVLLLQRLHAGGEHMPPPTLSEAEIRALIPYLRQLSDVPGAEKDQIALNESSYRIGEHIVKSTCHICHSATGSSPDAKQIMDGAIPPRGGTQHGWRRVRKSS